MTPRPEATKENSPTLRVRGLCKRYGSFVAVKDINLDVPRGSVFGLLGLNGAGKTTTLECALGLLRPDAGQCEILGRKSSKIWKTRGRVAVVFDNSTLHRQLTVRQNLELCHLALGTKEGLTPKEVEKLVGIDHVPNRRAKKLSLGMARRLSIARGFLGNPELVIMDEPLAGLDAEGVDQVLDLVRRFNRDHGMTFLLSSHRLHELQTVCDRVGLIHQGRVVAQGSLDELLSSNERSVRLRISDPERARTKIEAHPYVHTVSEIDAEPSKNGASQRGRMTLEVDAEHVATLNRDLVHDGFEVSELTPATPSLATFFREKIGIAP